MQITKTGIAGCAILAITGPILFEFFKFRKFYTFEKESEELIKLQNPGQDQ